MANRYNDQDYDRDERSRTEQRGQSGSGRENTQGGSTDYNREQTGYRGASDNRETGGVNQGFGGTGFQSGYFGSDFGRGYDQQDRDFDDFASSSRPGSTLTGDFGRNTGSNRSDNQLYGNDRDARYADRSGDTGGYGERTEEFRNLANNRQDHDYGYSGGGGSYARSNNRDAQDREHGGSSRYYGDQTGSTSYNNQGQQPQRNRNEQRSRDEQRNRGNQDARGQQGSYGQSSGYAGTSESGFDYSRSGQNRFPSQANNENEERGFWEKTTDAVASLFGDDEARERRERDARESDYSRYQNPGQQYNQGSGQNFGQTQNSQEQRVRRGPKSYRRSDERIKEDINDRLSDQYHLDATDIEVEVSNGEVILTGLVDSRADKRKAEDIAEHVLGVTHLENRLRIKGQNYSSQSSGQNQSSAQNQAGFSSANTANTVDTSSSGTFGSREDLAANYSNQNLSETSPIAKTELGDLTGSSGSITDTTDQSGGTNAGVSSGTAGAVVGSNPGTGAAGTATDSSSSDTGDDASNDFSERGVDRLSQPTSSKSDKSK